MVHHQSMLFGLGAVCVHGVQGLHDEVRILVTVIILITAITVSRGFSGGGVEAVWVVVHGVVVSPCRGVWH